VTAAQGPPSGQSRGAAGVDRKTPPSSEPPRTDDAALGLVVATARVALAGARLLARTPGLNNLVERGAETGRVVRERGRERIENAAQSALTGPEVSRLVDEALAGPLPEAVARSSIEHHVGDRLVAELESELDRLTQQMLASPEFESALERVLTSPKVREALTQQATGLAAEGVAEVRGRMVAVDEKLAFRRARGAVRYGGVASRALAFGADLVAAYLLFLVAATVVGLVVSIVGSLKPEWLFGAIAAVAWFAVVTGYFVFFWTLGGQTPAMRVLHLRVEAQGGRPPGAVRALVRFGVLLLSIIPMGAGLIPMLFDRRRRGLQDYVAGTSVSYVD
jgi:uncharacterized RDD family membrane protein YckC